MEGACTGDLFTKKGSRGEGSKYHMLDESQNDIPMKTV